MRCLQLMHIAGKQEGEQIDCDRGGSCSGTENQQKFQSASRNPTALRSATLGLHEFKSSANVDAPRCAMTAVEHNFSSALSTWKGAYGNIQRAKPLISFLSDINLAELQKTLDTQGIEIVDNQKESLVGRKALAERTKGAQGFYSLWNADLLGSLAEFKKIPDDEKLTAWKGLLKC